MARMVRKQVYITPEHDALLKRRASGLGLTESELIREGIERVGRAPLARRDTAAWREALAFMEERARRAQPSRGRNWTREDLYDDRAKRVLR
jgi:hypothetical protein